MHELSLILMLATGFTAALIFGYITERFGLSPIVGYLFAGIVIGPFTPGFVADPSLARQLADIGVILLLFGVGLHFRLRDLIAVRGVAIPGAISALLVAATLGSLVAVTFGWPLSTGIILGFSLSVASTVVLTRVLADNNVLESPQGHIAVGWLIVEDIVTVIILVLLPIYATARSGNADHSGLPLVVGMALLKVLALGVVVLLAGKRAIPGLLTHVARTRSRELFTLAVLTIAITVATVSALFFGASFALGAFLAGMVVGQSRQGHQAAADALPLRDAFAVLFFVSIGMLFDPTFLIENPALVLSVLGIILLAKPIVAMTLVIMLGYTVRSALTVALGLSQIGEFSFILASAATFLGVFSEDGLNALIAASLISIAINPLVFRSEPRIERWLRSKPRLWNLLHKRADARAAEINRGAAAQVQASKEQNRAIVIGYGPVGQTATRILEDFDIHPVVIELNIDTVNRLKGQGITAIYGDAARPDILAAAGIEQAQFLIITIPDLLSRIPVVSLARDMNERVKILVRARYLRERVLLEDLGATAILFEEAEAAVGLTAYMLREVGVEEHLIDEEVLKIRKELEVL